MILRLSLQALQLVSLKMKSFDDVFDFLNEKLFNSNLSKPTFKVDIAKKYAMRIENRHIVFGCEFVALNDYEIFLSLLHEMIHLTNNQNNLKDTGINQYHKKEFLKAGIKLGFFVIKHKSQGWSILSPIPPRNTTNKILVKEPEFNDNKNLIDILSSINISKELRLSIKEIQTEILKNPPSKTYFIKYQCQCPEPHNSIRSGRRPIGRTQSHPDAMCKTCKSDYMCVSTIDDL